MTKNILDYKLYYFLGAGGIGMSALVRYFNHYKKKCLGYDKTSTKLTSQLIDEGVEIHFDENLEYINYALAEFNINDVLIIYTPAIPETHSELKWLRANNYQVKKRSQVLGEITKNYKTIAVAGTHGKTTTATIVTHILKTAGINCFAFLGGISNNYGTNLILGDENETEKNFMVVEADEYDRSFLTLNPEGAIITSVDPDHLDIYGNANEVLESYRQFGELVKGNKTLIVKNSVDNSLDLKNDRYTYSVISKPGLEEVSFCAENISVTDAEFYFDYRGPFSSLKKLHLGIPGKHNIENAVAAVGISEVFGVDSDSIRKALDTFSGVNRRFEYRVKRNDFIYIDDYAHHPEEIKAAINAARALYPQKKLSVIFQPHLYSRTRDFADDFANSLSLADECILLPIYPAREQPIPGINSEMLFNKIKTVKKILIDKQDVLSYLSNEKREVLMTLGAGDIDQLVIPIENMFNEIIL